MTFDPVYLLDTNLIVRLLVSEPSDAAGPSNLFAASRDTFAAAAAGEYTLEAVPTVVAESVYVLTSVYKMPRETIARSVRQVLALPGVRVPAREVIDRTFDLFLAHRKLKWVDAYLLALAESESVGVASLDRPLARAAPPGVAVLDPSRP